MGGTSSKFYNKKQRVITGVSSHNKYNSMTNISVNESNNAKDYRRMKNQGSKS